MGSGTGLIFKYNIDYTDTAIQVVGNPTSSYNTGTLPTIPYTTSSSTTIYIQSNNNGGTNNVISGLFIATRIA
jgi:hypothetical protein